MMMSYDVITQAKDMLLHSLAWRKQYQIDRLLTWQPPQILRDYFIAGWHHCDNGEWMCLALGCAYIPVQLVDQCLYGD